MIRLLWVIFAVFLNILTFYWCGFDVFNRDANNALPAMFGLIVVFLVMCFPDKLPGEK